MKIERSQVAEARYRAQCLVSELLTTRQIQMLEVHENSTQPASSSCERLARENGGR
jgi:hypothetical protein